MGTPIANLLLGQAAPAGDALSGLSPETQAALRALNGQGGVPAAPAPPAETMPATQPPPPAQTMPAQGSTIWEMLLKGLSSLMPSTQSLAPKPQATPAPPPTPEQLAERNRRISGQQ
jgi:hypothetical protein